MMGMESEKGLAGVNGEIDAVVFRNDENGYAVLKVTQDDTTQATLVGCIPYVFPGELITAFGEWENDRVHGMQFKVSFFQQEMPYSENAIYRFLSSGMFKGIGQATATLIVNRFGSRALNVIANEYESLAEIRGINITKARKLHDEFLRHSGIQELMAYICTYNLRPVLAMRVYHYYGERSLETLRDNPYIIASAHIGGRFSEADRFALESGLDGYSPERIKAAVIFELNHNLNNGHCFIPFEKLAAATADMIGVEADDVSSCMDELAESGEIIVEEIAGCRACYLPRIYFAECSVAEDLARRAALKSRKPADTDRIIREISETERIEYSPEQISTLRAVTENSVVVITGGPGTGKTTTINAILRLFGSMGLTPTLCAPTGKAAKRMTEVTGYDAYTVHRLLGAKIAEDDETVIFDKNEDDRLICDALILDECSMVDIQLMDALIRALPDDAKLILVGDADQLPSVGPGNVFASIIASGTVPVVVLNTIFRQGDGSRIIENAHLINKGEYPDFAANTGDFFRLKRTQADLAISTICDLFAEGFDTANIQVLSPTRKGELGMVNLNKKLQERLNPGAPDKREIIFGDSVFREKDRVMQIRNDYDVIWCDREGKVYGNGIYNGDTGIILEINTDLEYLLIDFDGKLVRYGYESLIEIEHAWAMTVHKSQGSEFEAVIFALSANSAMLLTRDILYTAVSRAKKLMILVGDDNVAYRMIDNYKQTKRYNALKTRLIRASQ